MEKRKWDKLGIETSFMGFGCMRLPITADGTINEELAARMLDKAYQAGVNYYDTAYMYPNGESEKFLGKWLTKYDRKSYFLTTKLPVMMINSLAEARQVFEEQRNRLQQEYLDFYLLHGLNKETFHKAVDSGMVKYCEEMKAQGKIKYLGFSFHDRYEVFEEIIHYRDWDMCQIQLNYMDTEDQAGIKGYQLAAEKGIPLVIMEPVKGGSLATLPDEIAGEFKSIHPEASLSSWAYRWVGSLPHVNLILSGMSAMEHVDDNLNTFENFKPLNDDELAAAERVAAKIRERVNNGCTSCRYCVPCPAGVDIPGNFLLWNESAMYQNPQEIRFRWTMLVKDEEKAKNCIQCGDCEEKCPQKISIRDNLAVVQKELDAIASEK